MRIRKRARSAALTRDHAPVSARRAAETARSTSGADDRGSVAQTPPLRGSYESNTAPSTAPVHCPPTSIGRATGPPVPAPDRAVEARVATRSVPVSIRSWTVIEENLLRACVVS
jgi:hypothetical protein